MPEFQVYPYKGYPSPGYTQDPGTSTPHKPPHNSGGEVGLIPEDGAGPRIFSPNSKSSRELSIIFQGLVRWPLPAGSASRLVSLLEASA